MSSLFLACVLIVTRVLNAVSDYGNGRITLVTVGLASVRATACPLTIQNLLYSVNISHSLVFHILAGGIVRVQHADFYDKYSPMSPKQ